MVGLNEEYILIILLVSLWASPPHDSTTRYCQPLEKVINIAFAEWQCK